MPIEGYLGKDEEIVAGYGLHERFGIFYATNKRVIKWKKLLMGEDFSDLSYRKELREKIEESSKKGHNSRPVIRPGGVIERLDDIFRL